MDWKSILAQYSNPYEETVSVTVQDVDSGEDQTIISNKIHPFFVQVPVSKPLLHLTGMDTSIRVSSEGHNYQGPIANGHWVEAGDLKAGYRLLNSDESWAEVVSIRIEQKKLKAYNLTVADFHTYFVRGADNDNVQGIWVHNDCFDFSEAASAAAKRLGFKPDQVRLYKGTAEIDIDFTQTLRTTDFTIIKNTLKSQGADFLTVNSGTVINSRLANALGQLANKGKKFNGLNVIKGNVRNTFILSGPL